MPLVLASSSAIRRAMLEVAGIQHETDPAAIDEAAVKLRVAAPDAIALELAQAKAAAVSGRRADDWVIGADSVVSAGGRLFDKPADRDQAAEHLQFFSGRAMRLTSAVALARGGMADWSHAETAMLQVRELSDAFIASYLDCEWPAVSHCVGVFRLEGPGVQLFDRIDGDHFTILGMPLLPLLQALRERELIAA